MTPAINKLEVSTPATLLTKKLFLPWRDNS